MIPPRQKPEYKPADPLTLAPVELTVINKDGGNHIRLGRCSYMIQDVCRTNDVEKMEQVVWLIINTFIAKSDIHFNIQFLQPPGRLLDLDGITSPVGK